MTAENRCLAGRHAVVTGAGKGIGAAIANELARLGADLTIAGRDRAALDARAAELAGAFGVRVEAVLCDVADPVAVANAFRVARERLGDPAILVNNAGQGHGGSFLDTSRDVWERLFAVNVLGARACIAEVLPAMLEAKSGRIVNVASIAGVKGSSHITAYAATKHALVGLTRALAAEVATSGITVNAVCPGYTDTDLARTAIENLVKAGKTLEQARMAIVRSNANGRLIRPEEVASAVGWLCSPEALSVNGQAIVIAGGPV